MAFALPSELSLSQPMSSHTFIFSVLSISPGESKQVAVWYLVACWVKPQQTEVEMVLENLQYSIYNTAVMNA